MTNISPCKDCQKRAIGCHGECQAYISWTTEQYKCKRDLVEASNARRSVSETLKRTSWENWKNRARRGRGKIN